MTELRLWVITTIGVNMSLWMSAASLTLSLLMENGPLKNASSFKSHIKAGSNWKACC